MSCRAVKKTEPPAKGGKRKREKIYSTNREVIRVINFLQFLQRAIDSVRTEPFFSRLATIALCTVLISPATVSFTSNKTTR